MQRQAGVVFERGIEMKILGAFLLIMGGIGVGTIASELEATKVFLISLFL